MDKTNTSIKLSIISLLISISALIVTIYSIVDKNVERMDMSHSFPSNKLPIRKTNFVYGEDIVYQIPCEVILSNNSNRTISIKYYDLKFYGSIPGIWYTGLNGNIVKDNEIIDLPIGLKSGESDKYYIYIGIMIPKEVSNILMKNNPKQDYTFIEATKIIAKKLGTDLFGGKVDFENNGGVVNIRWKEVKDFYVLLTFYTGKNNSFNTEIESYFWVY